MNVRKFMTYAFCCVCEMNWNQIKVFEFSMRKMVNLPRKNNGKMDFTIQLRTNEEEEEIQKKNHREGVCSSTKSMCLCVKFISTGPRCCVSSFQSFTSLMLIKYSLNCNLFNNTYAEPGSMLQINIR